MKYIAFLAVTVLACPLLAQDSSNSGSSSQIPGNTAPPLLQRPYEAAKNFLNFFAFANGVLDTNGAYLENANAGSTFGTQLGGGVAGYHEFATGSFSLNYRGDYRNYTSASFGSGTDQNLSVFYQKRTRRWTYTIGEVAGIFYQGGSNYSDASSPVNPAVLVQTSPYAPETRFAGTTLSATYQQSLRLSYQITGSYFLNRYNGLQSIGSNNLIGQFSPIYRITRRTSISGTYSHSNYAYQHRGGKSNADSVFATVGHDFASHWTVSASGGFTRASSAGIARIPVVVDVNGLAITGFLAEPYNQTTLLPYYQGTVSRAMKRSAVSISGGESVGPGNGFYLASRTLNVNGYYSYMMRRSNFSAGAYISQLSSVANAVTGKLDAIGINSSYAYNLIRHLGLNARYDYIKYSNAGTFKVPSDSRISFGVYFTSKDIPLSWH